jgi:hypothetical protein
MYKLNKLEIKKNFGIKKHLNKSGQMSKNKKIKK